MAAHACRGRDDSNFVEHLNGYFNLAFLSLRDDRAKPKGSRDPLGFELVWTHFGRRLIGNLTTITSSLTNFAVALLGFHWTNELYPAEADQRQTKLVREHFLRYEQLVGYLRYLAGDKDILGVTRVSRRLEDHQFEIRLGLGPNEQILSDQASYGLWGLYSTALAQTGLVKGESRMPSGLGLELAQVMEGKLDKEQLLQAMRSEQPLNVDELSRWSQTFQPAINDTNTQDQLLHALMNGADHDGIQRELWRCTQEVFADEDLTPSVPVFIERIKAITENETLISRLADIQSIERLLVAANNIFHYCRRKDGESCEKITDALREYDYRHIRTDLSLDSLPRGQHLERIRSNLVNHDTFAALRSIFELNRTVMEQRDGAPWVEQEPGGTLRVRVKSEVDQLRHQQQIESEWDYDYFFSSYLQIASKALRV